MRLEPYLQFASKAFQREATYRVEVLSEIGSLVLRVYLIRALWTALYAHNPAPPNLPLHAIITYSTVALLLSLIFEVDGTRQLREKIRLGTIATDFLKPISLPAYLFSDGVGMTLLHALNVVPSLLFALLLVHVDPPATASATGAFLASFALGYAVNFLLNFCMNCVAFWTLETFALQLVVRWLSDLLSGAIIPLAFFPGIFQAIVLHLPFAAIYSTPLLLYLGMIQGPQIGRALLEQALWLAAFAGLGALIWSRGRDRVVVQGG
ncbi:MAG TPA: ABC-2 family transporter protein [Candidatus Dormibacteraeota bacterium]|nr:ABC-2 family transporter protein [Candidatus Dormibacteraeota bacterium]